MTNIPKDITGREIKIGDILAVGQRRGNSGDLDIRVVMGFKESPNQYVENDNVVTIKTTVGGYLRDLSKILIVTKDLFNKTKMEKVIQEELDKVKNATT